MVSIFSTIHDTVNKHPRPTARKGSVISISKPISTLEDSHDSHFISKYTHVNGQLKFYVVQRDYSSHLLKHLSLKKGTLVQLISQEAGELCYVRLIREVGSGLIPFQYLEEYSSLNGALPDNHSSVYKPNQLMEMTPPTSPSTLKSSVFSTASLSRGSSVSVFSSSYQETNKLPSIKLCEIVNIYAKDNRVHYSLKMKTSSNKEMIEDRFYKDFYTLHTKLLSSITADLDIKLPNLPVPMHSSQNKIEPSITSERVSSFNNYLKSLLSIITANRKAVNLNDIIQDWLMENEMMIKIKVLIKGDYYVMKCKYNDVSSYDKLKTYLINRMQSTNPELVLGDELTINSKIDGWYIVNLSNGEIFQEVFSKLKQTQKLVLEIVL